MPEIVIEPKLPDWIEPLSQNAVAAARRIADAAAHLSDTGKQLTRAGEALYWMGAWQWSITTAVVFLLLAYLTRNHK